MAIANMELMHKCFPRHSSMGTAKMKYDTETEEKVRREELSLKRSKVSKEKKQL